MEIRSARSSRTCLVRNLVVELTLAVECGVSNSRIWEVLHNVSVSEFMMPRKEYHALLKEFHGDKYPEVVKKGETIMTNRKKNAQERAQRLKALAAKDKAEKEAAAAAAYIEVKYSIPNGAQRSEESKAVAPKTTSSVGIAPRFLAALGMTGWRVRCSRLVDVCMRKRRPRGAERQ